jgi:hypothetical protein
LAAASTWVSPWKWLGFGKIETGNQVFYHETVYVYRVFLQFLHPNSGTIWKFHGRSTNHIIEIDDGRLNTYTKWDHQKRGLN